MEQNLGAEFTVQKYQGRPVPRLAADHFAENKRMVARIMYAVCTTLKHRQAAGQDGHTVCAQSVLHLIKAMLVSGERIADRSLACAQNMHIEKFSLRKGIMTRRSFSR